MDDATDPVPEPGAITTYRHIGAATQAALETVQGKKVSHSAPTQRFPLARNRGKLPRFRGSERSQLSLETTEIRALSVQTG